MSTYEDWDCWYQDNAIDLATNYKDEKYPNSEPESYEIFADKYPQWKAFSTDTDELLEAYLEFLENDAEWSIKFDRFCELEFHDMLSNRADVMADNEYHRQKEEGLI